MEPNTAKQHIAYKLRMLREKNGYTQKDIGRITGKAHTTVASWESAKGQPDVDTLLSLCVLYGVQDVLAEFEYKQVPSEVTQEERDILGLYRQLTQRSKDIALKLIDGLGDLEESLLSGKRILAVARGDGAPSVFEPRKISSLKELEDDDWKGE